MQKDAIWWNIIIMVCYHSINSDNNNIKSAAIIRGPQARRQQQQTVTFPQTEINLVNNALNILRFYITRNPQQQFQQPEEILNKVNQAIEIISTKTAAATKIATKGESNNNDITTDKYQSLIYFVKFKPDVIEWCSCPDNSMRGQKCKHIWSIEFAIRMRTLRDTDRLPIEAKVSKVTAASAATCATIRATIVPKSYTDDDYSF